MNSLSVFLSCEPARRLAGVQIRNAEAGALMELQPSGPDPLELPWEARAVALARIGFGVSPTRICHHAG